MRPDQAKPTALDALLVGEIAAIDDRGTPSGIDKKRVAEVLHLSATGFVGDHQGDLKRHGGIDKAVHHYPGDHYRLWRLEIGPAAILDHPGAFGENLSTSGLTEDDVAVGDRFRLGGALLEVSQGRQPCWKLNRRFGLSDVARRVQQSGRTGWYYRVIEEGRVCVDDALVMVERRCPTWSIRRLWHYLYVDTMNQVALQEIANLDLLPKSWRDYATKRLVTREVEDWTRRLEGQHQG
ncbi:hypothetical protein AC244_31565 [Ensifer adhaerens]|uniref:MOSC domain-containing protein n=1 Tax=Ensifer adhaerens TaxID=106592 RepID=A0A0L8BFC1_ENSAD|nr:MOSC domain-containing protein [Ensifer adhaerens]KOF13342.1 hypothetical protein AC244_31565 [Ensifer adhaerens]